jgi:hypothetical protein
MEIAELSQETTISEDAAHQESEEQFDEESVRLYFQCPNFLKCLLT